VNVNEEWPLHPDVSRSGRASVQLNGYRIGCRWKKISWEFRCLEFIIMPPLPIYPIFIDKLDTYRRRYKSSAAGAVHNIVGAGIVEKALMPISC
jgi:hypothetical protein